MEIPVDIRFRDVLKSEAIEALIRDKVQKLEKFCGNITACRVAIEQPHRNHNSGNPYSVRIDITLPPGKEVVVRKDPKDKTVHETLEATVVEAFGAAERQLKKLSEIQRGEVKHHE